MRVTDYTIGMAVLRIFRNYRVFHLGGALLLDDIADAWKQTGLRTRDLETGFKWRRSCACNRTASRTCWNSRPASPAGWTRWMRRSP